MAVLTISRECGSGGRAIGYAVAEQLGYEYVDKEKILSDIRKTGAKWEQWARNLDEHCPSVWEKYDWSFRGFTALVQSVILEYAVRDNVVIVGRGGNFLVKDVPHAYSIHVRAPLEFRIERITRREGVDRETAGWLCEKTDNGRACFIQTIYGKRWDDPAEYDSVLDAGKQAVEALISGVIASLKDRDRRAGEESRKTLAMKAAAAKVKAGIATDPRFFIPILDVFYDGVSIVVRGVTHSPKENAAIKQTASDLAGDIPVRCELHYRK